MADVFTPDKRREVMASIKSKNSKAELTVFRYLRSKKIYFQKHYKRAVGTPDLALPRKKRAVFVDGDFWHGRRIDEMIQKNGFDNYWTMKILRNIERDKTQRSALRRSGWSVLNVWESDINRKRTRSEVLASIEAFLLE